MKATRYGTDNSENIYSCYQMSFSQEFDSCTIRQAYTQIVTLYNYIAM